MGTVPYTVQVTMDCRNVELMMRFWVIALDYVRQPPPEGFTDWAEFAASIDLPPEQWRGSVIDPTGVGPRLFFQPVPEGKSVKNRVHLDIAVSAGSESAEQAKDLVWRHVEHCVEAGAQVLHTVDEAAERYVVLSDPEGNEFCIQ